MSLISLKERKSLSVLTALLVFIIVFGLGLPGVFAGPGQGGPPAEKGAKYAPNQFLVKFKPGTAAETRRFTNAVHGVEEKDSIAKIGVHVLTVPRAKTVAEIVEVYSKNPNVEFAEPDHIAQVSLTPNDPYLTYWQSDLKRLSALDAWDITTGGEAAIIAVIDTGAMLNHEDLAARLIGGYDFVNNDADPSDDHGHGTRVAGILGASTNNGKGIAGVTWLNPVMPVKVMTSDGTGTYSNIAKGIIYAADHRANVINLSLGGPDSSSTMKTAVDYAFKKNVVLVAAAGNSNTKVSYPAAYSNVIAVAALDTYGNKASYSNFGAEIDVAAPGNGIFSTVKNGGYDVGAGTSFAAPFVAGLAGLVLAMDPSLTPTQVQDIIQKGADDLGEPGWDKYFGWGRINMRTTLELLTAKPAPPVVDITPPTVNIISPTDGAVIKGTVSIDATAKDDMSIDRVEFVVDGTIIGSDATEPYNCAWDTTKSPAGTSYVKSIAYDKSGNRAESASIQVTVVSPDNSLKVSDSIGGNNKANTRVYRLQTNSSGTLESTLTWTNRRADLDLYLYNIDGSLLAVACGSNTTNLKEYISTQVGAPMLCDLKVVAVSGKTDFTLIATYP